MECETYKDVLREYFFFWSFAVSTWGQYAPVFIQG